MTISFVAVAVAVDEDRDAECRYAAMSGCDGLTPACG
jgi:hypothetical protein